jgi:type I phosphodiesterase/nucleotide pyrophosphatase
MTIRRGTILAALAAAVCTTLVADQGQRGAPKLVVILVVDQMRGDYLERYGSRFTGGLARLMKDGAWFVNAAYPYLNTVTCTGHSTIGTGTFPYHHGMILNSWLDRKTGSSPYCTDDAAATDISYNGLPPAEGDSAKRLLMPALGEQIRANSRGRAVAISLKPRSSIPLVGHAADAVIWFDERGGWSTSSAFAAAPVPFFKQYIDAHPLTAAYDKVWTRLYDVSAYQGADDEAAERPVTGMTRTFPHALGVPGGKPDADFYGRWQRSPFSDEYLGGLAAVAVDALKLGNGDGTDFLAVSFSALDLVGHLYGPRSHEVQDLLAHLDVTIGRLLDHLDAAVGAGNYVLGLSADHGVADIPEEAGAGGRQGSRDVRDALQKVLAPALGAGTHVLSAAYTDIYVTPAAAARLENDAALGRAALDALRALPGIAHAFLGKELANAEARSSEDPVRRAAALSYYPGRSGDIIVVPKPNWLLSSNVTTHGTNYAYDQRVPLILFGRTVHPGRRTEAATPADVAPSLAALAGVPIAKTDGRALTEAFAGEGR